MLFDEEGDISSRGPITGKGEGGSTEVGIATFCIDEDCNGIVS